LRLQSLQALDKLGLLSDLQLDGDSPQIDVEDLAGDGRHALILLALEHVVCEIREALFDVSELGLWAAPASALAALRTVAPAFVGTVRMVRMTPLRTINRYPLTGRASLRYP
jgi:hypothetical protein